VLKQFTDCLDDKYFLVYGTALGANREEDIIAHDLDIDVGIMKGDFNFAFVNRLINCGFEMSMMFGSLACGLEFAFKKDGVKVDLMVFYQEKDLIWNCLWRNGGRNGLSDMIVHSYRLKNFEVERLEVGENAFFSLGKSYVERVYGVNWRTPVTTGWNWRTDHCCIDQNLRYELIKRFGE